MFDSGRALHERGMPEQWRGREKQGSLGFPRIGKLQAKSCFLLPPKVPLSSILFYSIV